MFFFKRKKESQPIVQAKAGSFEKAFEERLGQDPTTYVLNKMAGRSDVGAIRNLFDIMAAEIELRSRCKSPGFDYYYEKALSKQILKPVVLSGAHAQITKSFAISQLIGKERFLDQYGSQLKALAENGDFMRFVAVLRQQLAGQEITNTREANKRVADYFYINKANERFSEVKTIVKAVLAYGKQASAHISIYYAMFIYQKNN
jgi:hypothetical protein